MVKKMSKKNLDQNGRLRNVVVGFRMSEEEVDLLNRRVLISGLTKQEFIINSILGKEVIVYGNPYVFYKMNSLSLSNFMAKDWKMKMMMKC